MALERWRAFYADTIAGVADSVVLCIVDSLTAGCASTGNQMGSNARSGSWPALLAGLFQSAPASDASWFGDANAPGDGKTLSQYDTRITMGAGWAAQTDNATVGHYTLAQQGGNLNALTFTPGVEFDRVRVFYAAWNGSPEYTLNVGGATLATLDMNRGVDAGAKSEVVACPLGTNPVNIVATADWGAIAGAYVYKSTVKQVNIINGGWWGSASADWAQNANNWQPIATIKAIAPQLTIIVAGANDCFFGVAEATFKANLGILVDACAISGDVLLVGFTPVSPTVVAEATQDVYLRYVGDVAAARGLRFVNLKLRTGWTSYAAAVSAGFKDADGLHNSGAGYADIAAALIDILDRQTVAPSADGAGSGWVSSTGGEFYAAIDERLPDDGDYAYTAAPATDEVVFGPLGDPGVDTGHVISYRLSSTTGGFVVTLLQGATVIASWTHGAAGAASWDRALSPAEAANIVYPATLTLRFEATP